MKVYYTHDKVSSFFKQIFQKVFSLSVPLLKNLSSIITSMIDAESVVSTDIARKFKDTFYPIQLASLERRFMRFFTSFSNVAYPFYESLISFVISNYRIKHSDKKVHISFDHMFCKDKFTILLFSLRIGKQGIPIWFRCFKGKHNPDAFKMDLIKDGIKFCKDLFPDDCHIIFLADRWFGNVELLSFIQNIGAFFCIRSKSFFTFSFFNKHGELITKHLRDIKPLSRGAKYLQNVLYTRNHFKTTIVVSKSPDSYDPWYIITNDSPNRAVRNYSYRFGSIESIFKNQKSNGFRLESTNTKKIENFISLFTILCIALLWLTIIGIDYSKNKHHYSLNIRISRKSKNGKILRRFSFFNLGLTIFNLVYYNYSTFKLKFDFVLYDI